MGRKEQERQFSGDLRRYLFFLRRGRGLTLGEISENVHAACQERPVEDIQIKILPSFEGRRTDAYIRNALEGIDPEKTIFILYLRELNPKAQELNKIRELVKQYCPDFDWESYNKCKA